MPNELYYQKRITMAMRDEGGYGKKWSSSWAVGVPDLILSHPNTGIHFSETKLERDWTGNTGRKIKLTRRQIEECSKLRTSGARVTVSLVVEAQFTQPQQNQHGLAELCLHHQGHGDTGTRCP